MTLDDILRMAREAGLQPAYDAQGPAIERFASLVAAAEREQCARLCEHEGINPYATKHAAAAIRARN